MLDNAPTYLTMLATALGSHGWSMGRPVEVAQLMAEQEVRSLAISLTGRFSAG